MRYLTWLMLCLLSLTARADYTLVAVAANFAPALDEIAERFGQQTGHRVALSSGASGKFYTQIRNRAPYEVFFSADQVIPDKLEQDGLVVEGTRITYAQGALVLWSVFDDQPVNALVLAGDDYKRLSIANPRVAPYGLAAMQTLQHLGLEAKTKDRLIQGENVAQAFAFVETRNALMGFVALSQVWRNGQFIRGSGWQVPSDYHDPILQDAVLLKRGENNAAARGLLAFMRSPAARQVLKSYGYRVPES